MVITENLHIREEIMIIFLPPNELFAYEKQKEHTKDGKIEVGPYVYDIYNFYTIPERQKAYQQCKKYLPWEFTELQWQWEREKHMYQFVIKPYGQYDPNIKPIPNLS